MKIQLCRWMGLLLLTSMLAACGGGGKGNSTSATMGAIQAQLMTWQNKFATSVPLASDLVLPTLFDSTFLNDGSKVNSYLTTITKPGVLPIGATFSAPVAILPLDAGVSQNDATHQWFTTQLEGVPLTMLAIKNASGSWLLAGNQRQIGVNVTPYAQQTIPGSTISSGMIFGLKLNSYPAGTITDQTLLNYLGVTTATVSGPGLIPASGVTIFTSTPANGIPAGSQAVPECNTTTINNCLNRVAVTPGIYTVNIAGILGSTAFNYSYNQLVSAQLPIIPASLTVANFPSLTSVTPSAVGSLVTAANVSVNWNAPTVSSNMAMQSVSMSGWGATPAVPQLFYVNLPLSAAGSSFTLLPMLSSAVASFSAQVTYIDGTGMSYTTIETF